MQTCRITVSSAALLGIHRANAEPLCPACLADTFWADACYNPWDYSASWQQAPVPARQHFALHLDPCCSFTSRLFPLGRCPRALAVSGRVTLGHLEGRDRCGATRNENAFGCGAPGSFSYLLFRVPS